MIHNYMFLHQNCKLINQIQHGRKGHLSILDDMTIFISQSAKQVAETKQWNQYFLDSSW
jgi:hypothetical protein